MILAIDVKYITYISLFALFFLVSYIVINATRFENLFKKGQVWQIVVAQIIISLIIAYLASTAIISLVNV